MSAQAGPAFTEVVSRRAAWRSATSTTTAGSTCSSGNNGGAPVLLKNSAGEGNHWLGLKLQGTTCNRDAIGATITWSAGGMKRSRLKTNGGSYLSSHDPREVLGDRDGREDRLGRNQVAAAQRPRRAPHRSPGRSLRHDRRRQRANRIEGHLYRPHLYSDRLSPCLQFFPYDVLNLPDELDLRHGVVLPQYRDDVFAARLHEARIGKSERRLARQVSEHISPSRKISAGRAWSDSFARCRKNRYSPPEMRGCRSLMRNSALRPLGSYYLAARKDDIDRPGCG